ncbi:hypothetical protein [Nocardia paucivorans]|uniref:hypothetical protein n=1 Tax=Nocardia paucivorans TaxID=114259 RepID=UPI0002FBF96C|nr:hypothetical protein [Nocardia paucivorans]
MSSCDEIATAWLSGTDFANDPTAVDLLSRAIRPDGSDNYREPLPISVVADPTTSATVLELLERGQVPTMAAVRSLTAQNEMRRETERIERLGKLAQRSIDDFGRTIAHIADEHWLTHGTGPTRRDVLCSEPVMALIRNRIGDVPPHAVKHLWLIERAQRAGWIAYNEHPRSLCAGRRYHAARHGRRVSRRPANVIGALVASYLADTLAAEGTPPTWSVMAHELRDDLNRPLFHDTADACTQRQWLTTAGWVTVHDRLPYPGPRGKRALARSENGGASRS